MTKSLLAEAKMLLRYKFLIMGKRFDDLSFEERMMIRNKIRELKSRTRFHRYSPVNVLGAMV